MSAFDAPPQTPPGAAPSSAATRPNAFSSVFSTSATAAAGLSAPIFGTTTAFGTSSTPIHGGTQGTAPAPRSAFGASVFQQSSQRGDGLQTAQRLFTLGVTPSGGGTMLPPTVLSSQLPAPQPLTVPPPVFPKRESGVLSFNPMAPGAIRGRGRGVNFGRRGAGRVDVAPSSVFTAPATPSSVKGTWQPRISKQNQPQTDVGASAAGQLLSTRVFAAFMRKILDENDVRREEAADFLEDAFFGVVGSYGGGAFSMVLQQMLAVWHTLRDTHQVSSVKGEHWVALFALGCHLNLVSMTILAGETEEDGGADVDKTNNDNTNSSGAGDRKRLILGNKWAALTNGCTYANLMCDIFLQLFSNQAENHVPYSVLPFVLRRVRNTFELANDEGVFAVQSNMKTILLKLYRYVRVPTLQQAPQSEVERQRTAAYACVLGELMLHSYAPSGRDEFVQSFHQHCGNMIEIRCTLYHHHAHNLLQEPLTDAVIQEAMGLLARAFVIVPEDAHENKRLLFVKLAACGLALGQVPLPEDQAAYNLTELEDLIVAVRSANWLLFDIAMRNNSEFYVQCGIHNVLQVVSKRIALSMVVKYYVGSFSSRLPVQDMIEYYRLPFTLHEGCHVWLLPLLVEKRINGVMESGVLVLSGSNPFDAYSKEALIALAASSKST
ncbi:hypothetical protein TraAM80_04988 [Trypanosoma rangeli]|uniref:Uncharacterized protein n=1 Tax=Trypanosoma rangeli TaxID=5698 RepID=A0A3S5IR75_TRYRA|nr:uncharacterized protein TraAM80_04988 [Trypanosoma rangeli]RNF04919.1 hypothetical protein TraAM80_04988 [Trypanosoma rangeli]|eukprot:RNF04919.1 hypothetical protein TraAM80_04988 [Trypanosoma rangeli]